MSNPVKIVLAYVGTSVALAVWLIIWALIKEKNRSPDYQVSGPPVEVSGPPVPVERSLIGQCAYNPSDMEYLGVVIGVGPEGIDAWGDPAPGQRAVTVQHPEADPIKITYPRYLIVRPC